MHISSSYAKILGETNFHTRDIPRSGSKAKDRERKKRKRRLNDGDNNGQATHGARKHAWRMQAAWAKNLSDEIVWQSSLFVIECLISYSLSDIISRY